MRSTTTFLGGRWARSRSSCEHPATRKRSARRCSSCAPNRWTGSDAHRLGLGRVRGRGNARSISSGEDFRRWSVQRSPAAAQARPEGNGRHAAQQRSSSRRVPGSTSCRCFAARSSEIQEGKACREPAVMGVFRARAYSLGGGEFVVSRSGGKPVEKITARAAASTSAFHHVASAVSRSQRRNNPSCTALNSRLLGRPYRATSRSPRATAFSPTTARARSDAVSVRSIAHGRGAGNSVTGKDRQCLPRCCAPTDRAPSNRLPHGPRPPRRGGRHGRFACIVDQRGRRQRHQHRPDAAM